MGSRYIKKMAKDGLIFQVRSMKKMVKRNIGHTSGLTKKTSTLAFASLLRNQLTKKWNTKTRTALIANVHFNLLKNYQNAIK